MVGRRVNTTDPREAVSAIARKPGGRSTNNQTAKRSSKKAARSGNQLWTGDDPVRLQRLLASAGFGSRRNCEELIEASRVQVNGEIITKMGSTVKPAEDKVKVDGTLLRPQKLVYFAVNKPVGVVTTNRDPKGRPRVVDLVPPTERVFPVGRLDRNSEGLILVTNDGELAQRLTHPKYGIRKIYRVVVAGKVDPESMRQMRKGIHITEGLVRVEGVKLLKAKAKATELEIVLSEGKNREIRRILARLGHKVMTLRRIAVGPLRLGDVPAGAHRLLTRDEVEKLYRIVEQTEAAEATTPSPPPKTVRRTGAKKRPGGRDAAVGSKRPEGRSKNDRKKSSRPNGRTDNAALAAAKPKRRPPTTSKVHITAAPGETSPPSGGIVIGDAPTTPPPEKKRAGKSTGNAGRGKSDRTATGRGGTSSRGSKKRPATNRTATTKRAGGRGNPKRGSKG